MSAWEILLIVVCAAIVGGVAISRVVKKRRGKSTCDCGCGGCCEGCPCREQASDRESENADR